MMKWKKLLTMPEGTYQLIKETYRQIWYTLYTLPDSGKWLNILKMSELLFSLPFSTVKWSEYFQC